MGDEGNTLGVIDGALVGNCDGVELGDEVGDTVAPSYNIIIEVMQRLILT